MLVETFSDRKLAPESEVDIVLQMQLASFQQTWNVGNSTLLVNYILGVV